MIIAQRGIFYTSKKGAERKKKKQKNLYSFNTIIIGIVFLSLFLTASFKQIFSVFFFNYYGVAVGGNADYVGLVKSAAADIGGFRL